jgi:ASC-1-like (ASCH) protein|tara:strand:+ start:282 stop:521 length:240 start_codon:yes stop_codon:yes gene_type:complete
MIKTEEKNYLNEVAKNNKNIKYQAKRIEVADVFDLNKYFKYKKALADDNVLEVFPDEDIFELQKMYNLYQKQNPDIDNK